MATDDASASEVEVVTSNGQRWTFPGTVDDLEAALRQHYPISVGVSGVDKPPRWKIVPSHVVAYIDWSEDD